MIAMGPLLPNVFLPGTLNEAHGPLAVFKRPLPNPPWIHHQRFPLMPDIIALEPTLYVHENNEDNLLNNGFLRFIKVSFPPRAGVK